MTTSETPVLLPAIIEGELRDLARDMRGDGSSFDAISALEAAERLEQILTRYSGIKPLRSVSRKRESISVCGHCGHRHLGYDIPCGAILGGRPGQVCTCQRGR